MTAFPETRYLCDRCGDDINVPADGSGPVHNRMGGPGDWMMLRLGTDPSTPPSHLCVKCTALFNEFMQGPLK